MDNLTSSQKKQLHEVADLMLDIYRTLVRMRYLDSSWIIEGPHNIDDLLPMYQSHGLDASIIYLYSILPYVESAWMGRIDFFQGSRFADFRDEANVETARDPFYADCEEEAMRPWMTPLSMLGNHRSVIIYSAKNHCIWIHDQESGGSSDHNLYEGRAFLSGEELERFQEESREVAETGGEGEGEDDKEGEDNEGDDKEVEEDDDEEEDDEGEDDEDEDDEDEEDSDEFYNKDDGRPAPNVLRDIVKWYHELIELPGDGDEAGALWYSEILLPLYPKHGWPSADFDGDAFQVDQVRAAAAKAAKESAEEPLGKVQNYSGWVNDVIGYRKRERADQLAREVAAATDDELWIARWELWKSEEQDRYMAEGLRKAEEAKCRASPGGQFQKPGELPLWEERQLRMESWEKLRGLKKAQQEIEQQDTSMLERSIQIKLRYAEKQAEVYQKAHEAARLDAERIFSGRLFTVGLGVEADGYDYEERMAELTDRIELVQTDLHRMREWIVQVPDSAQHAIQVVKDDLDKNEKSLKFFEGQRSTVAKRLEELKAGEQLK